MDVTDETIDRIADLGAEAQGKRLLHLNNGATVLVLDGLDSQTIQSLTEATKDARGLYLEPPSHVAGATVIQTADSLVDFVNRFKVDGAIIIADIANNRITAHLNYHKDGESPAHADFKAILDLPYSEEWSLWTMISGELMEQNDFGRFLKENSLDVSAPAPADLLEVAMDLRAVRNVNFTKAVRLNSENESFEYTDDTNVSTTKGSIAVPEEFTLRIPVYFGGEAVSINAALRHKLDGRLYLGIALQRAERVRQAVFKDIVTDIAARTGLLAVYGQ